MGNVADEIRSYYGCAEDPDILHYGIKRRSGRYPWGSGEDPYQHSRDFMGRVEEMRKKGFTYIDESGKKWGGDTAIAKSMGLTTTEFRTELGIAKDERRALQVDTAKRLRDKEGLGATEIGRKMGVRESTVRSWFNEESEARMNAAKETAKYIKGEVDKKKMVDVGTGTDLELGISKEKLDQALYMLKREGYNVYNGRMPQPTNPGQFTTMKVLCAPGVEHKDIYNYGDVKSLKDYISRDGGDTFEKRFHYPESMDSSRMRVRYAEDGGIQKDGLVEIRRGVPDLSLGESNYSQVRILVDGTHYIKGMAVYSDDLPKGVDLVFNTNKKRGTTLKGDNEKHDNGVLKPIKSDPDNPFGSAIKDVEQGGQYWYTDPKTGKKKLGLINKRADEGDWSDWKDALPSQFLSKQSESMAKKQLNIAKANKLEEYDEICSLTNPTIKKHLLGKFADECDSAAVRLQAAALPGQKYHVIVPVPTLKDTEVYAPNYENGTKLALIRYPHGGTFEIPILTVNNKHADAKKFIGVNATDAVCVNSKVAERLSGADFDGDTVMCIPTHDKSGRVKITSTPALKGLEGFDPKMEYGPDTYKGRTIKYMKDPATGKDATQSEMGRISNLITDMTLAGATEDELARAVRHSMVVIDAGKHKLDYKKSEIDNGIAELRQEYQRKVGKDGRIHYGGASTIISRASGEATVTKRQGEPKINMKGEDWYDPSRPEGALIYKPADDLHYPVRKSYDKTTGEISYRTTDRKTVTWNVNNKADNEKYRPVQHIDEKGDVTYTDKSGKISYKVGTRTQKSSQMLEVDDAMELVSKDRHPMELIYADYANSMKALANNARKEMMTTGKIKYDATANKVYSKEVDSLKEKLKTAKLNATRERQALRLANADIAAKQAADPTMSAGDVRKAGQQAVTRYRQEVGAVSRKKRNIEITDREWEAIQAGAISENRLKDILNNADIDKLRERATPRAKVELSSAKVNQIKALSASYTNEQIADKLGISPSTVAKYLRGGK